MSPVSSNTRDHTTPCCRPQVSVAKCPITFHNFDTACGGKESETERTFLSIGAFTREIWLQAVLLERHFKTGPLRGGPLHGEPPSRTPTSHPNQLLAILISLITPTTAWLFAGYLYTTRTQKAEKISQLGTLSPQRINERLSLPLICSQIHVTTFSPMAELLFTLL